MLNKRKITRILLSLIALMSVLITLKLINDKNFDFNQNILNKISIELTKRKPRIFCMITTRAENHEEKAIHARNTWAKRCDQFLFVSSENNTWLPAVNFCKDDYNHLWCKV